VRQAEDLIRADFGRTLDELLRQRGITQPEAQDDRAVFSLADAATRRYHAATAGDPKLPRLSKAQLWEIRQRLYIAHCLLGPLGELLAIEGVEDIHINGTKGGCLVFGDRREKLPARFQSEEMLTELVRHYAEQAGKHFDPANPMVTVTLRDGSRLNAVLPPVAKPLVITIRKQQMKRFLTLRDMAQEGALPARLVQFLEAAVIARLNILISGATGAGKTTLARVLALLIPAGERTCVLETETELWLHELQENDFFSFEAREANIEGAGRITLTELFQYAALRQRPERIIVGEVRAEEAMDMLHAMTSGHDGSLTTIHTSGIRAALSRLETLAMRSDANLSHRVVRQMVGSGVDLIIHLASYKRPEGRVRRLAGIAFIDENPEDRDGRPAVIEFCRYRVIEDDWEIEDEFGLSLPRKVEEKLLMAGLRPADFRPWE
jgi:pilus assembly protein CpaF